MKRLETDILLPQHIKSQLPESKHTNIKGREIPIPTEFESIQEYAEASDEVYDKLWENIKSAESKATELCKELSDILSFPFSGWFSVVQKPWTMTSSDISNAINIESTIQSTAYSCLGGIVATKQTTEQYNTLRQHIGTALEETALHRMYFADQHIKEYDEQTTELSTRLKALKGFLLNNTGLNGVAYEGAEFVLDWLTNNDMPVNTIKALIESRISKYQNLLQSEITKRISIVTTHVLKGPSIITDGLYRAKSQILRPMYYWITQLPPMPAEVDAFLTDITNEAEDTIREGIEYTNEMLKLSVFEKYIHQRQAELQRKCQKMYDINTYLQKL